MSGSSPTELLAAAAVGVFASLCFTPLAVWFSRRMSILDRPAGYKAHSAPTPLFGGVAVGFAALLGAIGFLPADARGGEILGLAAGAGVILVAGLVDDIRGMSPSRKFIWQLAAVATVAVGVTLLGIRLSFFLAWPQVPMVLLTVLWIVGITNAVNFQDNMNGLCAGLGAVGAASLAAINLRNGEPEVAVVAAALAGACLGFLPFNWPRARIFLGDAGSMLIGFLLAGLSVMGVYTRDAAVPEIAVYSPLFALAVPLADLAAVAVLRTRVGQPVWIGDRRHVSHRLVRRGLSPAFAVAVVWTIAAACAFGGVLLPTVEYWQALLLAGGLIVLLGGLFAASGSRGLDD